MIRLYLQKIHMKEKLDGQKAKCESSVSPVLCLTEKTEIAFTDIKVVFQSDQVP